MSFSFLFFKYIKSNETRFFTINIGANITDRVKTELNLAISEAARTYQEENIRYFSRNRILAIDGTAVNMPRNPKSDSYIATRVYQKATINYTSHHYMMCLTRPTYIA